MQTQNATSPAAVNFKARAPHIALADQVELQGMPMARMLFRAFGEFNERYFSGGLLPCFVEITPAVSIRALADYRSRSAEGVDSAIRMSPKAVSRGALFALDVLLHEMIHAYMQEVIGEFEAGYKGHGPIWTKECNRIGKILGLPPVFTKGRGGPNSAQWPLCVRPAGYYGAEEKPKAEREPKEPASPEQQQETMLEKIARLLVRCDAATLEIARGMVDRQLATVSAKDDDAAD